MRITARMAGDMTTTAAVREANGQEVTAQDWLYSFLLAGVLGQATSDLAKGALGRMERRFGITFANPAAYGAVKGGLQGWPGVSAASAPRTARWSRSCRATPSVSPPRR